MTERNDELYHYGRKGMKKGMNIFNPDYKPIGQKAMTDSERKLRWKATEQTRAKSAGNREAKRYQGSKKYLNETVTSNHVYNELTAIKKKPKYTIRTLRNENKTSDNGLYKRNLKRQNIETRRKRATENRNNIQKQALRDEIARKINTSKQISDAKELATKRKSVIPGRRKSSDDATRAYNHLKLYSSWKNSATYKDQEKAINRISKVKKYVNPTVSAERVYEKNRMVQKSVNDVKNDMPSENRSRNRTLRRNKEQNKETRRKRAEENRRNIEESNRRKSKEAKDKLTNASSYASEKSRRIKQDQKVLSETIKNRLEKYNPGMSYDEVIRKAQEQIKRNKKEQEKKRNRTRRKNSGLS